jgi:O-antigen ligase
MNGELSLQKLLVTNRERSVGTMTNSNMFADYMMFSMFVLLGLVNQVRLRFLVPALLLVLSALITTKSNGGLVSLLSGLVVWGVALAWARGIPWQKLAGTIILTIALVSTAAWLHGEFGIGDSIVRAVTAHSYVGRMGHSGAARGQIWHRLEETYAHSPLGIGPKNSSEQTVEIGERERPDSFRSKEAHNDYLAFGIERGPLGLLGLLLGTWQAIAMVVRGRRRMSARLGGPVAGSALWAACMGALVGSSIHSTVIEKLHFRHFWLFLAMVTAMCIENVPAAEPARRSAPEQPDESGALPALRG